MRMMCVLGLSAHAKSDKPAPKESNSEEEYENSYSFHKVSIFCFEGKMLWF